MTDTEVVFDSGYTGRQYWRDLWRYRELLVFLTWRDLLVRYKQTAIGVAWAVLRPLTTMIVFTLIFGRLAGLPSEGVPYSVMVLAGLLPWQFFSGAIAEVSNSFIANANIISKVYFPRLILPISAILVALVDMIISSLTLFALMAWYGIKPGWPLLVFPLFLGLACCSVFAFGLWLAAMNVRYRDVRYIVPVAIQLGLFVSPVAFSASVVPAQWRILYFLNPMANVIEGFRWSLLGTELAIDPIGFSCSLVLTATLLIAGIIYFRRVECDFADVI